MKTDPKDTERDALIAALPDLIMLIRRDGTILSRLGGAGLGPKADAAWAAETAYRLRRIVRHAIAKRGSSDDQFTDGGRRYEARATAKGPDEAVCVIRAVRESGGETETAGRGSRHLDRRDFMRRLTESLSVAVLKEERLAVAVIQIEGLREASQVADSTILDRLAELILERLPAPPQTATSDDPAWHLGQLSDNLMVCLVECADRDMVETCVSRLCSSLRMPVPIGDAHFHLKAFAGAAMLGLDGATPKSLIESARTAALEALRNDSPRVHFFSDTLKLRSLARLDMHREMRAAIDNGEIRLRYAGRHDLRTGQLVTLVGYLYWKHPLRGEVRPAEFLNVAEATGLSEALGQSMIQCLQADLPQFESEFPPAVRLSFGPLRHHVLDARFLADMRSLAEHGAVSANRLELRIAERVFITSDFQVWRTLASAGFRLVVDEVGRKMSSFDQLTRAPLNGLQLDRSWTSALKYDEAALKVCRAAIGVAAALNLTPIATGVDDEEQRDLLLKLGCHQGLGDLYDPAAPGDLVPRKQRAG